MLHINVIKFIQDNYQTLSIEEISKATSLSVAALKRRYHKYFYPYQQIVYWKKNKTYYVKTSDGYDIIPHRPRDIPSNYRVTATPEFIRWHNSLFPANKTLDKGMLEKIRETSSERIKYKGKNWKLNDSRGAKVYYNITLFELGKILGMNINKVSYYRKLGIIERL